jgi:hypothetical protein
MSCPLEATASMQRAGTDVVDNTPLMNTSVSMTTRSPAVDTQDLVELVVGEAGGRSFSGNGVAQVEECLGVARAQPLIVCHRQDDSDVSVLASNDDRFALGVIDDRAKPVLGFGRGDSLHVTIIAM